MVESVMRQGLTTWLNAKCENAGNSMIYAILGADIAQTEALRLTIPNLPPDQTVYIAENVDNLIRSAVSSMTNLPIDLLTAGERQEVFEVKSEIEELLKAVRHPDVPGRPELMESLVGKLYGLNLVLRKMLLEKVVECQCGKAGGEKYAPPTIKFPEDAIGWEALGNKIKTESYRKYGEREDAIAFELEVNDNVHAIQCDMPDSENAKRWLMAKAGVLDIKEY